MKHLKSLYPISGGVWSFPDAVFIQRLQSMALAPRVFFSPYSDSLYTCVSTEVSQYFGLVSIDYPQSYNPHTAQTRKG
jgi:hypothetical protein